MQCISNAKASIAERSDSGQILVKFSKPRQLLKGPVNVPCYYMILFSAVGEHKMHAIEQRTVAFSHTQTLVYGRFPDGNFPGWFFSRKDVSLVVIFPDETFPRKTS